MGNNIARVNSFATAGSEGVEYWSPINDNITETNSNRDETFYPFFNYQMESYLEDKSNEEKNKFSSDIE